ncbi:pre-mRNA-splicing factor 38B [Plasmodium gonderi]|uniref:Pre-mRNA-splicing factor 38B n=1 Tax=Plasmodium gonderi TaxID=77519 RepID=A0A1Y1JL27_PLAGO|nr:pre-mRNA-splicing factor 38B [Plasmodium gonderi]GAW83141.1 pre-mRNA-splicing factor 38B [Plasmodium gonderi]
MDKHKNNEEYPISYPTNFSNQQNQINQLDQNDMNKQMYDYYYYNNNPDIGINNERGYNNISSEGPYNGNYAMNYGYMDPSFYHMNNAMHSLGNVMNPYNNHTLNRFQNRMEDHPSNYLYNNIDYNVRGGMKYKLGANNSSNSAFHSSLINYNNEEKKNILEMTNTTTYNVNILLRNNILSSEYFRSLVALKTFKEVVDEIHLYADHVEPYCVGSTRAPSTLFCCLYRLFTMQLSEKQMKVLIESRDSCYVRACGFLYLRYVHAPANLWMWFEPYLLDEDMFTISSDKRKKQTIGEYIQCLLSDDKYFNTVLPRMPIKIKNTYGARLMLIEDHRRRLKRNKEKMSQFVKGEPVMAYVNGEWEKGEIGGIVNHGKEKIFVRIRKIDGNEKLVNMGYVKLVSKESDKEKDTDRGDRTERSRNDKSHRRRGRSRSGRSRSKSIKRRRRRSRSSGRHNRGRHRDRSRDRDRSHDRDKRRKRRTSDEQNDKNHSSGNKSHTYYRDRSVNKHSKRSHEGSHSKKDKSLSRSYRSYRSSKSSRSRNNDDDDNDKTQRKYKYENNEDELINKFRKIESQKALATGKDYARRPTSYKSSLTIKVENILTRKKSVSRSPKRIDKTVYLTQKDEKNNENTITENSKLMALMQKYNKDENSDSKDNINSGNMDEMDVMTLG